MNERIKEIALQAEILITEVGAFHNTPHGAYQLQEQQLKKFAELIVRECMLQVADVRIENDFNPAVDGVLVQAMTGIKKYFGVEE